MKTRLLVCLILGNILISYGFAAAQSLTLKSSSQNSDGYVTFTGRFSEVPSFSDCTYDISVAPTRAKLAKKGMSIYSLSNLTQDSFPLGIEFINIDIIFDQPVYYQAKIDCSGAIIFKSNVLKLDFGVGKKRFKEASKTKSLTRFVREMKGSSFQR